jgi:hypothetical protein
MNTTKTLICILTAGAALGAAAPVFADAEHDRGYGNERGHYSYYDRHDHRGYFRNDYRDYYRPRVIVRRPYIVEQPAYYPGPAYYPAPVYYSAPVSDVAAGAIIGAAIGGLIVSHY